MRSVRTVTSNASATAGNGGSGFGGGFAGGNGGVATATAIASNSNIPPFVSAFAAGGFGGLPANSSSAGSGAAAAAIVTANGYSAEQDSAAAGQQGGIAFVALSNNILSVGSLGGNTNNNKLTLSGTGLASIGAINGTGATTIKGSATLRLLPYYGTSSQNSLAISGAGKLDITNTTMAINFGTPANDPVAAIAANLTTGYNGGAWTGTGIDSSTAAAGTNPALSVGYADGNTDSGTPAGPNQILIKYTLAGDSNLDGFVNFLDLVAVVQNFNKAGADWAHGNFTYGASTNFNDLVAVVQNFNKTLTPAGSSGQSLGGSTIALGATAQIQPTVVRLPEPGALGFMAAGAAGLLARRRRKEIPSQCR